MHPGFAMTHRSTNRLSMAIVLGVFVTLAQIGAFTAIGIWAWHDLVSPSSSRLRYPLIPGSQVFRGEVVIPVCTLNATANRIQSGKAVCFRCIDLQTGRSREIEIPNAMTLQGLVSSGERMWCFAAREIFEFDGTTLVKLETRRSLGIQVSSPFLYEGNPALIDRDAEGNDRLLVLVDSDWQDKGQVVLPGANRKWTVDEQTGQSTLVPRTSADSLGRGPGWLQVHVFAVRGQYHVLQIQDAPPASVCYRVGFDFVVSPSENEPVSALAPGNAPAETTGWVLLDSKLFSSFGSAATLNDELVLAGERGIWRQSRSNGPAPSTMFQQIANVDIPALFLLSLVSDARTHEVYVLAAPMLNDIEVYRLRDRQLQKMPYQIEGFGGPMQRWMTRVLWRSLAVLCVGALTLILIAASLAGASSYSFGRETVLLAPLLRRSVARGLDMLLILGPLAAHSYWLIRQTTADALIASMNLEDLSGVTPLIPATAWLVVMWSASVISTGLWGVTLGKWLFGVRVVRTTLRPCGIFPALLRELLFWFDAPLFLTAMPGVLCQLATENRQRIGDLFAGTLVLEDRPIIGEIDSFVKSSLHRSA